MKHRTACKTEALASGANMHGHQIHALQMEWALGLASSGLPFSTRQAHMHRFPTKRPSFRLVGLSAKIEKASRGRPRAPRDGWAATTA